MVVVVMTNLYLYLYNLDEWITLLNNLDGVNSYVILVYKRSFQLELYRREPVVGVHVVSGMLHTG